MEVITKKDLIKTMVQELKDTEGIQITQKDLGTVIDVMTASITDSLVKGCAVKFPGFVTFETQDVAERNARNPQNGESVPVPAHRRVKVKVSKPLKEKVY